MIISKLDNDKLQAKLAANHTFQTSDRPVVVQTMYDAAKSGSIVQHYTPSDSLTRRQRAKLKGHKREVSKLWIAELCWVIVMIAIGGIGILVFNNGTIFGILVSVMIGILTLMMVLPELRSSVRALVNVYIDRANLDNVKLYSLGGPVFEPLINRSFCGGKYMERLHKGLESNDPQFTVPFMKFYDKSEKLLKAIRENRESSLPSELKQMHIDQLERRLDEVIDDVDNTFTELVRREIEERMNAEVLATQEAEQRQLLEQQIAEHAQTLNNQMVIANTARVLSEP